MNKKELGQHWLRDNAILQAIVEAGEVANSDYVLEVGPGEGTLTSKLLDTGADVHAVEFDTDLIPQLKSRFSSNDNFTISESDIRKFNFDDIPKDYKIVANIPYYLTSHLIRQITDSSNKPKTAVLLVQKEVAERICAREGQMSVLSLTAQYWFECTLDVEVPAEYFTPPPKVDSQVVVMRRRDNPAISTPFDVFTSIISTAFSQKRKKLSNSLQGLSLPRNDLNELFMMSSVNPNDRAQHLSLTEWESLCTAWLAISKRV